MSLQSGIRLLETTQPTASSSRVPTSPTGAKHKHKASASLSSLKKYEPWNDMHFSVDGVIATTTGIGGLPSVPTPTTQQGPGNTSEIAPWTTDDLPVSSYGVIRWALLMTTLVRIYLRHHRSAPSSHPPNYPLSPSRLPRPLAIEAHQKCPRRTLWPPTV